MDFPNFWGDMSAFESMTLFDSYQWIYGFTILIWTILLGPVTFPFLSGQVDLFAEPFDFIKFSVTILFYPWYSFFLGWENVTNLFEILLMDFNAQSTSALMFTIIFPFIFFYWYTGEYENLEKIDSDVNFSTCKLTFDQGTVYHYWFYSKEHTWYQMLWVQIVDLVASVLSVAMIVTLPL